MNWRVNRRGTLLLALTAALLLSIVPLPEHLEWFRPYWAALVVIYWVLEEPQSIGLGAAFLVGVVFDLLTATLLGLHALSLVILVYLVRRFRSRLRFFPPWQQAMAVLALLLNDRIILLWVSTLLGEPLPTWHYWLAPLIGTFIWPWLFLFLDRARIASRRTEGLMARGLEYRPLKDQADEQRLFNRRARWGLLFILLCFLGLTARYFYLQVLEHREFSTRSDRNRVHVQPVPPNRGLIYDRRGRLLAENRPAYRLELVPEKVADVGATLDRISEIVRVTAEDRKRFREVRGRYRDFQGIPIRFNLSEDEVARFAVNRYRFQGVDVIPYLSRHYPRGELMTHVLGYVGRIDAADLARVDEANYRGTTHIGKTGVERYYETSLHGRSGIERVETNARGRVLQLLERQDPLAGNDLVLSVDVAVQQAAWGELGDRTGAAVAIDPRDGSVIALVSKPAYDGNAFVHGIGQAAYQAILAAPGRPLFNRAISGGYEPGSTLKPFIGLAGLELDVTQRDTRVFSSGKFYLDGQDRPFRDWKKGGHGWADIEVALEQSVNTYFYKLARDLGIDRIHSYLDQFGFGRPTGIDLPGESSGLLPSRDWKRGRYGEAWYPGETVITGIGQGFNVVTPVQLATALAALVNGGIVRQPRLLYAEKPPGEQAARHVEAPVAKRIAVTDPGDWEAVLQGMWRVVNGTRGTARRIGVDAPYEIAGKTGTAQVYRLAAGEEYEESEVAEHLRHHALFIAFAPFEDPRIVVAVVVDHGGAGSTRAAPVARAVLDAWLRQDSDP